MNEQPPEPQQLQDALSQQAPDERPVPVSPSAPPTSVRGEIVPPQRSGADLRVELTSGPLPDPETYRQLAAIIPDGAERIMRMAEKEQDAAIWAMKAQEKRANSGVFSALGVALGAFTLSGFGFYMGAPVEAAAVAGATLVALVGVFVRGTATHNRGQAEDEDTRLPTTARPTDEE